MLPNIKLYYKSTVMKMVWYWHKNSHKDPWNRTESPEITPQLYSQLTFDRGSKRIQWAKDSLLSKCCWENWTDTCRKMKLGHFLTLHTRINSKLVKDLSVRLNTIKTLEENMCSQISDIACSKIVLDTSPQVRDTKEKINKWDYIKPKNFCTAKEIITK